MRNFADPGVCELLRMIKGGVPRERITRDMLDKIEHRDGEIRAYMTVCADGAMKKAHELDEMGEGFGVPFAVKDNIITSGVRTTCASRMLENYVPAYDATAVGLLSDGVLLGKTNLDEFGMGTDTARSCFFCTRNPLDTDRVPGGSSGGSAAAVAAGEAAFALGTDTGGSVRQPAAFCGVVGMKPTYGRVSRYGLVAYASSLDQIGLLCGSVEDCAEVLPRICGIDAHDATSADAPAIETKNYIKGMRIAVLLPFTEEADAEMTGAVELAARLLAEAGAEVAYAEMKHAALILPTYRVIACAEAFSNLGRYDGVRYGRSAQDAVSIKELYMQSREGFGAEVKSRIAFGAYALSEDGGSLYRRARAAREDIKAELNTLLDKYDILLSPAAAGAARRFGESARIDDDFFTAHANLAGLPAISMPYFPEKGMPLGIQLTGRAFAEGELLSAARALERGLAK